LTGILFILTDIHALELDAFFNQLLLDMRQPFLYFFLSRSRIDNYGQMPVVALLLKIHFNLAQLAAIDSETGPAFPFPACIVINPDHLQQLL
jgi:hypothetical protein